MSGPGRHRYPGPESFRDDDLDRLLFQGRGGEGARLLHLTLAEDIVVLYARSGTGKTSLINTKLLQPLRERQYLPVVARVGDGRFTPAEAIFGAVMDAARSNMLEIHEGDHSSLFSYFRTLEVWRGDILLTPVVILDQFEELFTVRTPDVRDAFARELAVLRGRSGDAAAGAPLQPGLDEGRAPVKLLLSLREDSIGELEELSSCMPDILRHRFRIGPLSEAEARAAIIEPAKLSDPSLSAPAFEWAAHTVTRLIGFLHQRRLAGRVFTSSHVEPFQLQLICRHVEEGVAERHAAGQKLGPIDYDKDIGGDMGAQRIVRSFYERQLAALAATFPVTRLRRLCEEGLITSAGRRAILDESTIQTKYKLGVEALDALSRRHVIRVEPRGEEKRYELSHDTLVAPILDVREDRRRRRIGRGALLGATGIAVTALAAWLVVQSDRFQEWQAVREGSVVMERLRGEGDNVIRTWSLALGWANDAGRARSAAEAIEQPPMRVVALTRLARALAALDERGSGPLVQETLLRAVGIARRLQDPAERTRRLIDVATTAESVGLQTLGEGTWKEVEPDDVFGTWFPIISEASERRATGRQSTPGLDAALDHLAAGVANALHDVAPVADRSEKKAQQLTSFGFDLLPVAPEGRLAPLVEELVGVLSKTRSAKQTDLLMSVARTLVDRGSCDPAVPIVERAQKQFASIADTKTRLVTAAEAARLLDRCGQGGPAATLIRRVLDQVGRDPVLSPLTALAVVSILTERRDKGPAPSPELENVAATLRQLQVRRIKALSPVSMDERDIAFQLWEAGEQDAALRAIAGLDMDAQARVLFGLAWAAKENGRRPFDRGLETARRIEDPASRGSQLAAAVAWLGSFAPGEFDGALKLVQDEKDRLAREPMLQALVAPAENPRLAESVATLVLALPAPADPASIRQQPAESEASDRLNALERERLARLRLMEAALTTLVRTGGALRQDVFAAARTEAGRLASEGRSRAEWLGRLGILAARGGDFAQARQLALDTGDAGPRLTVLSAIVAVGAARRAPNVGERIYAEVLPVIASGSNGGGF